MTGPRRSSESMTIDMCQQFCQQSANTYFGLEVYNNELLHLHINGVVLFIQKPDDRLRTVDRYTSTREVVYDLIRSICIQN